MLGPETTQLPTLEVVWLHDATAYAFVRALDGTCGEGGLLAGAAAELELEAAGAAAFQARKIGVDDLIELADKPPGELALGDSARCAFALVTLARRTVSEGLVHPQLTRGGNSWFAFWGATLDDSLQTELNEIAAALPPVAAEFFLGDRTAAANGLYPHLGRQDRARSAPRRGCAARQPDAARPLAGARVRSFPASPRPTRSCPRPTATATLAVPTVPATVTPRPTATSVAVPVVSRTPVGTATSR